MLLHLLLAQMLLPHNAPEALGLRTSSDSSSLAAAWRREPCARSRSCQLLLHV
jgi:hypothetical protein